MPGKQTFTLLKRYKEHLSEILSRNNHNIVGNWEFDNLVTLLRDIGRADIWIPPLLRYRDQFGSDGISTFLKKLENKFSADWILRETPTVRIEAMNRILKEIDKVNALTGVTKQQKIDQLLQSSVFSYDVNAFLRQLDTQDVYGQRYGTYILYKVDLLLGGPHHRLQPPLQISVEHILPQSPATSSQWHNDFTATDREQWTHRLGNLVLIGRRKNTSLGRLDFIDKKQRYFHSHIQPFPNSLRVMNQNSQWTLSTLQASHQAVLDALRAHYQ